MANYQSLREECCTANLSLAASGLVDLTFGNVSVVDRSSGVFAIKPSGIPYADLTPSDMVILSLDGEVIEGTRRPSSDTPTHRRLFLNFDGINAVAHTHSRNAVAFAQAGSPIPLLGTTHADYFHGTVPVTRVMTDEEIDSDYEWETGAVIVEAFTGRDPMETPAVLVRNHGPFVWSDTGAKAVETALALEIIAQMAIATFAINPKAKSPGPRLQDKHFYRKHGAAAYYGQPDAGHGL